MSAPSGEFEMANPQKENGFVSIATELVEAFARTNLTPNETKIIWAIIRKTFGWHKKIDEISFSNLANATGINRSHVARSIKSLVNKGMIIKVNGRCNSYQIQKNYDIWQNSVTNNGNTNVTKYGNPMLPDTVTKVLPALAEIGLPDTVTTKDNKDKKDNYLAHARGKAGCFVDQKLVEEAKHEVKTWRNIGFSDDKIKKNLMDARGFTEKQADEAMGKAF